MAIADKRRSTRKGCPNRTTEFKREIAAAASAPGISVAKLALERGVNTSLLFKWRREYRAGKFGVPESVHPSEPHRRGVIMAASKPESAITLLPVQASPMPMPSDPVTTCIEVVFRGATVRIHGNPELAPLRTVLDVLARRT